MINRKELEGNWNQIKGQIRERWGHLSDDELQEAQGDAEQLIGLIQQKTGHSRQEVEEFLDETLQGSGNSMDRAKASARKFADDTSHRMQESYKQVQQQLDNGMTEAQQMVRTHPMESVMTAFGAGIVAGVVVSLLLRPSRG